MLDFVEEAICFQATGPCSPGGAIYDSGAARVYKGRMRVRLRPTFTTVPD